MKQNKRPLTAAPLIAAALLPATALADLLGIVPGFPQISYDNTGTLVFDAATMRLDVDADPLGLRLLATDTDPFFIVDPRSLTIHLRVDGACSVAGGNSSGGPDLEIVGDVLDPFTFEVVKSGTLLTGSVVDIGEAQATATTSAYDFRFANAGGLLVTDGSWPSGRDIGIVMTSANSNFVGDCTLNFRGGAQGVVGPIDPVTPPDTSQPVATQGYWKNHLEAWPVPTLTVGGVSRTAEVARNLMLRPPKGDKTWSLYGQLTAAMLNLAGGSNPECIATAVSEANLWLATYPLGSGVSASSPAWQDAGDALHEMLDAYNNGVLCAPHRSD